MAGAFFFLRLNDHVQYLRRIQATLEERDDFHGTCHTSCKLGRWLYGNGPEEATSVGTAAKEVFDALFEPHERFHHASKEALQKKQEGDMAGAEAAVTEMHQLSTILIHKLIKLDKLASRPQPGQDVEQRHHSDELLETSAN